MALHPLRIARRDCHARLARTSLTLDSEMPRVADLTVNDTQRITDAFDDGDVLIKSQLEHARLDRRYQTSVSMLPDNCAATYHKITRTHLRDCRHSMAAAMPCGQAMIAHFKAVKPAAFHRAMRSFDFADP